MPHPCAFVAQGWDSKTVSRLRFEDFHHLTSMSRWRSAWTFLNEKADRSPTELGLTPEQNKTTLKGEAAPNCSNLRGTSPELNAGSARAVTTITDKPRR